ncbi:MAG TPA: alpha/beta fold hydrolase [Afifellaceae bacterium]|nr:alpha/beta fold hydrolase [Afifellaceae bacterium]
MLHSVTSGREGDEPVVLLHGFGGSHRAWDAVIPLVEQDRRVIAYDLPGHAGSLAYPKIGNAAVSAKGVLADLAACGIDRAHFVGHSMGGAAAALCGLMAPERCASLTLLAPGGFGWEVNHRLLRRYAEAREAADIAMLLEQFFGWQNELPAYLVDTMAVERAVSGAPEALEKIVETLFDGTSQKRLPIDEIAALPVPVKVIWGTQDRVLPTRQAHKLPGRIAVHIFEEVGHMLPMEIPADIAHLILENSR